MEQNYLLDTDKFNFNGYLQTVTRLLWRPGEFFKKMPRETGLKQPAGFLLVSSIFFVLASLLSHPAARPFAAGGIYFLNAVGMTFIAACIGYILMIAVARGRVPFRVCLSIYAYASGVTLLISWFPMLLFFTELWKWWLIGTGLTKGCGLIWWKVLVVIGVSIGIMILSFWSFIS